MEYRIPASQVQEFSTRLLAATGVPREHAQIVADVLVNTTVQGIETHGISRLPVYLTRLQNGRINNKPDIKINRTARAMAVVDGDNGLGQLVAVRAMKQAIGIAGESGVGVVAVRHSNHFGAATYYCRMAANADMIGIAFTNSPPGIPPWGGKKAYFGTNPIAFGFPTARTPIIVDMSSSTVARGNIIMAAKDGRVIPDGWAIDADGKPTTDPREALKGAVLPLGGPKGYALAIAVEMLAGVVSGSAYGDNVGWIYDDKLEPADVGHFFIALSINPLMPLSEYISRVENMKREIRSVPLAENVERVLLPGERKEIKAAERAKNGIPVTESLLEELNEIAASLGMEKLLPDS